MHANLIRKMRNANQSKCRQVYQPHIRIEIDDIGGVPDIYIDGKRRYNTDVGEPLVKLKYDWHTDADRIEPKRLYVKYLDITGDTPVIRKAEVNNMVWSNGV